jgi:hypothetical protein
MKWKKGDLAFFQFSKAPTLRYYFKVGKKVDDQYYFIWRSDKEVSKESFGVDSFVGKESRKACLLEITLMGFYPK